MRILADSTTGFFGFALSFAALSFAALSFAVVARCNDALCDCTHQAALYRTRVGLTFGFLSNAQCLMRVTSVLRLASVCVSSLSSRLSVTAHEYSDSCISSRIPRGYSVLSGENPCESV